MQFPILIGWLNSNLRGRPQQAISSAVQLGIGNCANFVASNVFITTEAPRYPTGFATGVGFASLSIVALILVVIALTWHNREFDRRHPDAAADAVEDQEDFRYVL